MSRPAGCENNELDDCNLIRDVLRRRNSVLRIVSGSAGLVVEKTYHARYTARQEYEAYLVLDSVLVVTPKVRRPLIHHVDDERNAIQLEYIEGENLRDSVRRRGLRAIEEQFDVLIPMLAAARTKGVRFDSDLANFIVSDQGAELVVVDPVAAQVELADFNAVVFLLGLLKGFLSSGRWHTIVAFAKCWKRYYAAYIDAVNTSSEELNIQIVQYIDLVIDWNRNESYTESHMRRIMRRLAIIPMWRVIQVPFRCDLVKLVHERRN